VVAAGYITGNVRPFAIALVVLLCAQVVGAAEEKEEFHVVQLAYAGDRTETKVLSSKDCDRLRTKMNSSAKGGESAGGAALPKWIIIQGTYPTRAAAEAKLNRGAAAKRDDSLLRKAVMSSGGKHRPTEHDPDRARRAKEELERKKRSRNPKIEKMEPLYDFPDKLVDTGRLIHVPHSAIVEDPKRAEERRKQAELERQANKRLDPKAVEERRHADDLAAAADIARKLRTAKEKREFADKLRAGAYPALTDEERQALINSLRVPERE